MNGMSQFQNIPDFAHANGMCSFRNWMHYTNLTRDAELQPDGLLHIKNHRKRFSNSDVAQDLYHELNVLRPYVSGCDRSYQHTDYHYCSPTTFLRGAEARDLSSSVWTRRTTRAT